MLHCGVQALQNMPVGSLAYRAGLSWSLHERDKRAIVPLGKQIRSD